MTVYYPSARVRLQLRTEEYEDTSALDARLPPPDGEVPDPAAAGAPPTQATTPETTDSAADALARNTERRASVERLRGALSEEEIAQRIAELDAERERILAANAQGDAEEAQAPEAISGSVGDDLTVLGEIEPISATIEWNGLAQADTASVVLDYADAPFDPRILRSAHVELIIGTVSADDHADGIERGVRRSDGSLVSLVARDGSRPAARFVGFVDDWNTVYSDDGDSLKLECRDMSAIIRDIKLPPGVSINLDLPLDEGVAALLNQHASTRGVVVRYVGDGDPPTPANAMPPPPRRRAAGGAARPRRRPRRGRVARRARSSGQEMTMWDHITDVVRSMGLIAMVRDFELLLADPRTLYTEIGERRMVYGRNLETLEFSRKLGGVTVPTIEVRSYDSERGRTLWARYPTPNGQPASGVVGVDNPPRANRANNVPPSGANPDEDVRGHLVSGVTDPARLGLIARGLFEEIGRQEIEGTFGTHDAWSYDSDPAEADLLTMRSGDAVTLLVAAQADAEAEAVGSNTSLARIEDMDRQRRVDYLTALGWPQAVARRFSDLQAASGFQTTFRVQDARIAWDHDSGLRIVVGFINYIVVREEAQRFDMDFSEGGNV